MERREGRKTAKGITIRGKETKLKEGKGREGDEDLRGPEKKVDVF